jgi:hypothetical protein
MIQIAPQMRILLAVEPVDFRKYAQWAVMQSRPPSEAQGAARDNVGWRLRLRITSRLMAGGA